MINSFHKAKKKSKKGDERKLKKDETKFIQSRNEVKQEHERG